MNKHARHAPNGLSRAARLAWLIGAIALLTGAVTLAESGHRHVIKNTRPRAAVSVRAAESTPGCWRPAGCALPDVRTFRGW